MVWKASDFERLDPKLFRSFLAVMRTDSMSEAARIASLTQGAISQQIGKLEERLETQLFVRTAQGIVPTDAARMLGEFAEQYLNASASFLERLNVEFESMNGLVRYAMPESCIHSPHFPMLLERRREFSGIEVDIALQSTEMVYRDLLAGEIDFGFTLQKEHETQVTHYPFCVEQYGLIAARQTKLDTPANMADLQQLDLIWFPQAEHYLNRWSEPRFQAVANVQRSDFRVRGSCTDLRGALAMVRGGLGMAVVPLHVVADDLASGAVVCLDAQLPAVGCQIYIATPRDKRPKARVRRVIRWFLEMHTDLQPVPEQFLR